MSDGTLSVRRRQPKASETAASSDPFSTAALQSGTFESFLSGALPAVGQGRPTKKGKGKAAVVGDADEFRIESRRTKRLKEFDRMLKGFKYSAALDAVLRKVGIIDTYAFIVCLCDVFSKCHPQRPSHLYKNSYIETVYGVLYLVEMTFY